jgi:hypothetical protein
MTRMVKQETVQLSIASTLQMEAVFSSEMLVSFYWTSRCHIPGDDTPHNSVLCSVWL